MTKHYFILVNNTVVGKRALGPDPNHGYPDVPEDWVEVPSEVYFSASLGAVKTGDEYVEPAPAADELRPDSPQERLARGEAIIRQQSAAILALQSAVASLSARVAALER